MLKLRDVVRHRMTGAVGVIVPTVRSLRNGGLLSVIFEGSTVGSIIGLDNEEDYEVVRHEEPVAELGGCGVGRGEEACVFVVIGMKGPECRRYLDDHWYFANRRMVAKRNPPQLFPGCKIFADRETKE